MPIDPLEQLIQFTGVRDTNYVERALDSSCSSTIANPLQAKAAALLFNKIWVPPMDQQNAMGFGFSDDQPPINLQFFEQEDLEIINKYLLQAMFIENNDLLKKQKINEGFTALSDKYTSRSRKFVNTLTSFIDYNRYIENNLNSAYSVVIDNVAIPVNKSMEWKQVLEIRRDKKTLHNYRSFKLWVDDALRAKSKDEAKEIFDEKYQLYLEALDKHGVYTRQGVLASTFSGLSAYALNPSVDGVAMSFTIMGGVAIAIREIRIANESKLSETGLREMAWVHQFHKRSLMQNIKDWFNCVE